MEIGPIPGLRAVPMAAKRVDLGLPAIFDIENYAHIHHENHASNSQRNSGGMEGEPDEADEELLDDLEGLDSYTTPASSLRLARQPHRLNFFA